MNSEITAYSRVIKYTPETGFLYSSRMITNSIQETRFLAIYIYMEYAVDPVLHFLYRKMASGKSTLFVINQAAN